MNRTILCLGLALALLFSLVACQGEPAPLSPSGAGGTLEVSSAAPSQPPEPQAPSSGDGSTPEEPPTADLGVPIRMGTDIDYPQAYKTTEKLHTLGTQAELNLYNNWMSGLEGGQVTALYGWAGPVAESTPGTMSLADSQALFQKLKTIRPTLLAQADLKNPYTGGGMGLVIQTDDERAVLTFNGGWFVVYLASQDQQWVFGAQEKQVQDPCYELMETLSDNMNLGAATPPPLYFGVHLYEDGSEVVDRIYAVNTASYTMAEVTGYQEQKRLLSQLTESLAGSQPGGANPDGLAFLVLTQHHREYLYLDGGNDALTRSCQAALGNSPLHPSWLIHMTPGRLVSANGVTRRQSLDALAAFLKEQVLVQPSTSSHQGPSNPDTVMGLYMLTLEFDSGVVYTLIGYDYFDGTGTLSIHTSDLDTTVHYGLENGVSASLRQTVGQLS